MHERCELSAVNYMGDAEELGRWLEKLKNNEVFVTRCEYVYGRVRMEKLM